MCALVCINCKTHICDAVVFVCADNNLSHVGVFHFVGEDGDVCSLFNVELFNFVKVNVECDVCVGDDHVFLTGFKHKSTGCVKCFNLALVHVV